jgi:hypothetical protein
MGNVDMRLLLTSVLLMFSSTSLLAQSDGWTASSESAMSVTGNITMETDRIRFANGASLKLVPLKERIGVFKADPPSNPLLQSGNRLCKEDVTFVVLAEGEGGMLFMKIFDGSDPPLEAISDGVPQEGSCATFEYIR